MGNPLLDIFSPPAVADDTGTGKSLQEMADQRQIYTDSGISYPSTQWTKGQLKDSQTNPNFYRQASQAQINELISQGTAYKTKKQPNSIYGVNREPWIFAVFEDIAGSQIGNTNQFVQATSKDNALLWVANPKSVSWQINQRGTEVKNKSGTVLHVWRDKTRKSDYDDPKIIMQFQTGNIMPNTGDAIDPTSNQGNVGISGGLNNFFQFLGLVDRQKLTSSGKANLVHILYRSRIFPSMILTGFFDPQAVVQFTDDSQNPFQVSSWQVGFTIYSTVPKINNPALLKSMFETEGLEGFALNPAPEPQLANPRAPR